MYFIYNLNQISDHIHIYIYTHKCIYIYVCSVLVVEKIEGGEKLTGYQST